MTFDSLAKAALFFIFTSCLISGCSNGSVSTNAAGAQSLGSGIVMAYAPLSDTNDTSAQFNFDADTTIKDLSLLFQCSLDGGQPFACQSGINFENLSNGTHTLTITATDTATGDVVATVTVTWTVDPKGPPCPTPPTPLPTPCILSLASGVRATGVCGNPCPEPPCPPPPTCPPGTACPQFIIACPIIAVSLTNICVAPPLCPVIDPPTTSDPANIVVPCLLPL